MQRLLSRACLALLAALLCTALLPAASLAASAPSIGSESASVSEDDATLEVPVRPEGLATKYQFWIEYAACQSAAGGGPCEAIVVKQVGEGQLPAADEERVLSAQLSGLQWSYTYAFWVVASNADGTSEGPLRTFTVPSAPPEDSPVGGGVPAEFKAETWNMEGARREGEEAPRLEAEREALQKEAEERPAREAAERAAREREIREAGERAGREAAARELLAAQQGAQCLVPALRGDSLAAARSALRRQHCRLGEVARPRRHDGALVVTGQSDPRGTRLPPGASVALRLGDRR